MTHRFHPEALAEWHEAAAFYEERQEGLGGRFVKAVRDGVRVLMQNPKRWPGFTKTSRAYRLDDFPFRLVYAFDEAANDVLIVTVMHTKRDSDYIEARLR